MVDKRAAHVLWQNRQVLLAIEDEAHMALVESVQECTEDTMGPYYEISMSTRKVAQQRIAGPAAVRCQKFLIAVASLCRPSRKPSSLGRRRR